MNNCDFSGWATRNDLRCGDGRVIKKDAFKDNDGKTVSLVWNHDHTSSDAVLGHALLENRDEGVYAYGFFNDTEQGLNAKKLVQHGDVSALSIFANKLKQKGSDVVHGTIRELSLVLAGANPGAYIDFVMAHSDTDEECIDSLYAGYDENIVIHSSNPTVANSEQKEGKKMNNENKNENEKTVADVFNELTEEQKTVVYAMIGQALEDADNNEEGDNNMKHNIFENNDNQGDALMHSELMANSIADAKRYGSLKEAFMQHASEYNFEPGFDKLFPEPHNLNNPPEFIRDDDSWVSKIMSGVHHTPFSRVKSTFAQLDANEARARGYIKGNMKRDIALATLKRTTTPTTVYIKMKMDRDDIVDITDFDVVAWQRAELRRQLDRELAMAMMFGDGRDLSSEDKINEQNIRPVIKDDDMFTIKYTVTDGADFNDDFNSASDNDSEAKGIIRAAIKARKDYKGSGNPIFFTTEDLLTKLLLIEDQNGRRIYESITTLATAMRVKEIVTVPEMESHIDIYGIILNPADYSTGADKGGEVNMFDDFDIDFNQMKYLMETRMSGALTKPYSAILLKKKTV